MAPRRARARGSAARPVRSARARRRSARRGGRRASASRRGRLSARSARARLAVISCPATGSEERMRDGRGSHRPKPSELPGRAAEQRIVCEAAQELRVVVVEPEHEAPPLDPLRRSRPGCRRGRREAAMRAPARARRQAHGQRASRQRRPGRSASHRCRAAPRGEANRARAAAALPRSSPTGRGAGPIGSVAAALWRSAPGWRSVPSSSSRDCIRGPGTPRRPGRYEHEFRANHERTTRP